MSGRYIGTPGSPPPVVAPAGRCRPCGHPAPSALPWAWYMVGGFVRWGRSLVLIWAPPGKEGR